MSIPRPVGAVTGAVRGRSDEEEEADADAAATATWVGGGGGGGDATLPSGLLHEKFHSIEKKRKSFSLCSY
jgi:hypothetical protein